MTDLIEELETVTGDEAPLYIQGMCEEAAAELRYFTNLLFGHDVTVNERIVHEVDERLKRYIR